jgi:hypothetical protein
MGLLRQHTVGVRRDGVNGTGGAQEATAGPGILQRARDEEPGAQRELPGVPGNPTAGPRIPVTKSPERSLRCVPFIRFTA